MKAIISYIVVFVAVFFGLLFGWYHGHPTSAEFFLKCITPIGTVGAISLALFGDYLRARFDPIILKIEIPYEINSVIDNKEFPKGSIRDVFVHHLQVKNLKNHRTVTNCRVWLKRVYIHEHEEWNRHSVFAVPRLMNWAPNEISPESRTFSNWQVFDIGYTFDKNGGFHIQHNEKQGGAFTHVFRAGETIALVFYCTADNYQSEQEFAFILDIPHVESGKLERSKIGEIDLKTLEAKKKKIKMV